MKKYTLLVMLVPLPLLAAPDKSEPNVSHGLSMASAGSAAVATGSSEILAGGLKASAEVPLWLSEEISENPQVWDPAHGHPAKRPALGRRPRNKSEKEADTPDPRPAEAIEL